jgi:Ca-activated chloride channel family protein
MIALTDGNDTGSRIPPIEAAEIARNNDITLHVIGVGDPTSVGEEALDEVALRDVAATTGGRYFYAGDQTSLTEIYQQLDEIEAREVDAISYRPVRELYHWPLAVMLLASAALLLPTAVGAGRRRPANG